MHKPCRQCFGTGSCAFEICDKCHGTGEGGAVLITRRASHHETLEEQVARYGRDLEQAERELTAARRADPKNYTGPGEYGRWL